MTVSQGIVLPSSSAYEVWMHLRSSSPKLHGLILSNQNLLPPNFWLLLQMAMDLGMDGFS